MNPYPNYGGAGGMPGFGAPPGVGGLSNQQSPPPNLGQPPSFGAPGMQHMQQVPAPQGFNAGSFQPPPNMANFDMNARVIRLGSGGGREQPMGMRRDDGPPHRRGLGAQFGRDGERRDDMRSTKYELIPLSHEEQMRTIGILRIPKELSDEWLEQILGAAGGLRRFSRVLDSGYKPTHMAFAEYEDADSLRVAVVLFASGIPVPLDPRHAKSSSKKGPNGIIKKEPIEGDVHIKTEPGTETEDSVPVKDEDEQEVKPRVRRLKIVIDEQTNKYIEQWGGRSGSNEDQRTFRLESGREELRQIFARIKHSFNPDVNTNGDGEMVTKTESGDIVTIPLPQSQEDELSDIPPEQREQVMKEITNFREASMVKDAQRRVQQEAEEELQRKRNAEQRQANNNVPSGPRGTINTPHGPAGWHGGRLPHPFHNPVESHYDSAGNPVHRTRDSVVYRFANGNEIVQYDMIALGKDARTDEEINEARLQKIKDADAADYARDLKSWEAMEYRRLHAFRRKKNHEAEDDERTAEKREEQREYLHNFNDDKELERGEVEYLVKPKDWAAKRARILRQELADDEKDRMDERREQEREEQRLRRDLGEADEFLARETMHVEPAQQPFRMSLGAAAQRSQAKPAQRRTLADMEGFLDNEADEATERRPGLVPLPDAEINNRGARMTEQERKDAAAELIRSIPKRGSSLWEWKVRWDVISDDLIEERVRPYMNKRIIDLLGVQEEELVNALEHLLKQHATPGEMVLELEPALDDEAEPLVCKIWRMVVFFGESEYQGLGA